MTTFLEAQVAIARALKDESNDFFSTDDVKDMIQAAMAEVGRIAPMRFQEDVAVVADTLEYNLSTELGFASATPEIEVKRVEVWDTTTTPESFFRKLYSVGEQPIDISAAGYELWNGVLRIPNMVEAYLDGDKHVIKVWGFKPYAVLSDNADVLGVSHEQEQAVLSFAKIEGLVRVLASRDVYTQWQTRTGNTDVSPASLSNQLAVAREDWRRRSRALLIQR